MLTVTPIPAFRDNYLWLIENEQECWAVDPGDADVIKTALQQKGRELTGILVTHHHSDHIGGIEALVTADMPVIGPAKNQYKFVNDPVSEGQSRRICGVEFSVLDVPGHTLNHLAYFAEPDEMAPILFCGDTLFAGGCGRLFEGTPEQMHDSLSKLRRLPSDTLVYCAHEYTLANLAFARHVEPGNVQLKQRELAMQALRERGIPTLPSDLKTEIQTNPFLRTDSNEIQQTAQQSEPNIGHSPVDTFAAIRRLKDNF